MTWPESILPAGFTVDFLIIVPLCLPLKIV